MTNPFTDDPDAYDFPSIGGERSPLLVDTAGASSPREWEEKKAAGHSGATIVYNGDGLAEFTAIFYAWTPEHFEAWAPFRQRHIAKPPGGAKPTAQDYAHPFLAELGIVAVVVKDESEWVQGEPGMFSKEVKFGQYREAEPAQAKPKGSTTSSGGAAGGAAGGGDTATPEDEHDKLIGELNEQIKEEAAK